MDEGKVEKIFFISESVNNKFMIALQLRGQTQEDAERYIEQCMISYAKEAFSEEARALGGNGKPAKSPEDVFSARRTFSFVSAQPADISVEEQDRLRMLKKIAKWAKNPQAAPHILIKAYLSLLPSEESVDDKIPFIITKDDIKEAVQELGYPEELFKNNYPQMKRAISTSPHSHGLVFEERNGLVSLAEGVREAILAQKDDFLSE